MSAVSDPIPELFLATKRCLFDRADPLLAEFLTLWPGLNERSRWPETRDLPVLTELQGLSEATGDQGTLLSLLLKVASQLAWGQTYQAEDFGPDFLNRYGWTELVGMRGPVASEQLGCGFLVLGAETTYPAHSHQAEEIYLPLTGPAKWLKGEQWSTHPAGTLIHHAAWEVHAMQTLDTPLVALYLWRGGPLVQKSRIEPSVG